MESGISVGFLPNQGQFWLFETKKKVGSEGVEELRPGSNGRVHSKCVASINVLYSILN